MDLIIFESNMLPFKVGQCFLRIHTVHYRWHARIYSTNVGFDIANEVGNEAKKHCCIASRIVVLYPINWFQILHLNHRKTH